MRADVTTALPKHLSQLIDPGSFLTIRSEVRSHALENAPPGDGIVCGSATIGGRRVFCYEQDASVLGGSLGAVHADSMCRVLDLAGRFLVPVVGVHRSGGARIQEGVASLAGYARIFARHVRLRHKVPQIALVFGPCAGGAAYGPALMDFIAMPSTGAYMFLTGPDVVRQVTGEEVGFEALGGAGVQGRSGLASLVGSSDEDTLDIVRRLLSFLPDKIGIPREVMPWTSDGDGIDPGDWVPADPRRSYDIRKVIGSTFDDSAFLELHSAFAPNLVVGFARLCGHPVGIVANQPQALAGTLDIVGARKGAWFVNICNRFEIPLVVFVDTPGFLPGRGQELGGVIPHGAQFLRAFAAATVPKVTVIVRKAYGGAYIVMNSKDLGADYAFAWPGAEIAVMGAKGAVSILSRRALAASGDPEALRVELEHDYRTEHCTPWPAARAGFIDEVIEPRETRRRLSAALGFVD